MVDLKLLKFQVYNKSNLKIEWENILLNPLSTVKSPLKNLHKKKSD